jgi:Xaa-Pro aminopeptidase
MRYASTFNYDDGYILVLKDKAFLLTDFRYVEAANAQVNHEDFEVLTPKGLLKSVASLALDNGVNTVLVEESSLSLEDLARFEKAAEGAVNYVGGASAILTEMRMVKTEAELNNMAEAQRITDAAFSHILTVLNPNMTEIDVALELEFFMRKNGAERTSFDTIAVSGTASSMPHGVPRNVKLERGFLTMDFGCVYGGYCSDMTRTVVLGKADEEIKRVYNTVLEAQTKALEAAANGERGCYRLDEIARDIINGAGYEGRFGHSLGHGVGMFIHESPRLAPAIDRGAMLVTGNVVTFEPGIYIPETYGCRIEDMAAITDDGIRNFTKSTKDLIELF